jgi:choline monooxygenase
MILSLHHIRHETTDLQNSSILDIEMLSVPKRLILGQNVSNRSSITNLAKRWSHNHKLCRENDYDWKFSKDGIHGASTPPSSWYHDQHFYNHVEQDYTFKNNWLCVGRVNQIPNAGNYFSGTILNEPFVVVNNGNGNINAFSNVCRHHAALLCDEDSTGSLKPGPNPSTPYRLTCPYHGWQYSSTTGGLTKAVKMKGCKDFSASKTLLPKYDVSVLGPWIFLRMRRDDGATASTSSLLDDQPDVKEYASLLENSKYNEDMVHLEHRRYHIKCNWKVYIDNYLDGGYHVPIAHPELSESLDMTTYTRQRYQNTFIQTCKSRNHGDESKLNRISTDAQLPAYYIFHYPNLCINRYGHWLDTNIVWPISANECVVYFDWYVHKSLASDDVLIKESLAESHRVQLEDVMLCERVHKGLLSSAYDVGRYAPELEDGEYFFHQKLYEDYQQSLGADSSRS